MSLNLRKSPAWFWIELLAFTLVYIIVGRLGLLLNFIQGNSSPLWIPTGLSLAYIWIRGPRVLPAITLGALAVNLLKSSSPWYVGCLIALGNTLEAWTGYWLLRRVGFCPKLERVRDVMALLILPMPISTLISATFGAASLYLGGIVDETTFFPCLAVWWLGDALSVIIITPFLLTWWKGRFTRLAGRAWSEITIIFLGLIASTAFSFTTSLLNNNDLLLLALGFPFLTSVALRFGQRGTTAGILAVSLIAIVSTISGSGPFNTSSLLTNVCGLNIFLGLIAATAMIVCALTQERLQADAILKTEHATFNEAESIAKIGSWLNSASGEILWWSDEMYHLCGHPLTEALPSTHLDFMAQYVHPEDRERLLRDALHAMETQSSARLKFRIIRRNGEVRHMQSSGRPFASSPMGEVQYIGTTQDVTDQVNADQALRASESRYRLLADNASDVISRHKIDGTYIYLSPSIRYLIGYEAEEIVGKMPYDFIHPDDIPFVMRAHQHLTEVPVTICFRIRHQAGHYIWVETKGNIIHPPDGQPEIICQLRDISERKRLEEQIQQSQKMEAIGRLAGGIAHDFNNLLTVINGFSEVLIQTLPQDDPSMPLVQDIHQSGVKAAALTKQLLAFSRRQLVIRKVVDLNEIIDKSLAIFRHLLGKEVNLTISLAPRRAAILADPGQLDQVIINLVVNARDAMPTGGNLTLNVSHRYIDGEGSIGEMPAGEYVVLAVSDTGSGMDDETKALIFEPFFTTKEQGKGTGLGLATVYAIMEQAKGHITVDSEPGRGTTFRLFWPSEDAPTPVVPSPMEEPLLLPVGTAVILVVEDDVPVRNFTTRILRDRGYRVFEAGDGLEALRLCEKRGSPIDLVITDIVMPHMNGRELSERLRRLWPRIPILFLSGYTNDSFVRQTLREESGILLTKPFTTESLLDRVRELLRPAEPMKKN